MTFEAATGRVFAAIQSQDLDELSRALEARAAAIQAGVTPTVEMIEAGERALRALGALRKRLVLDSSRLRQIHTGLATSIAPRPRPRIDYFL
jgi:hypothetical protein